jgi:RecJ-like exonuclease
VKGVKKMKSGVIFLWIVCALSSSVITRAELCDKCKKLSFDAAAGKCQKCGGDTSSMAFSLCHECSDKLSECEHCRKKLNKKHEPFQAKVDSKTKGKNTDTAKVSDIAKLAEDFWTAIKNANLQKMKEYYAEQVILLPGSELIRGQWGIKTEPDESGMCIVPKTELINAYETLINKTGRETWRKRFDEISPRIVSTEPAKKDDQPLKGVKSGDWIMKVTTMVGGETFYYVWRKTASGQLRVVIELADY